MTSITGSASHRKAHRAKAAKNEGSSVTNIEGLLQKLAASAEDRSQVSVKDLRDCVGRRSFAPLLLAASLIGFTPLGAIPGVPTTLAAIIIAVGGQILMGMESLWLPKWLLTRHIKASRITEGVKRLRPAARLIDRIIRPRLVFLTERPFSYLIAAICVMLAFSVPPLELVPLLDVPLWAAIVALSLALVAHDGVLAILSLGLTLLSVFIVVMGLWG